MSDPVVTREDVARAREERLEAWRNFQQAAGRMPLRAYMRRDEPDPDEPEPDVDDLVDAVRRRSRDGASDA